MYAIAAICPSSRRLLRFVDMKQPLSLPAEKAEKKSLLGINSHLCQLFHKKSHLVGIYAKNKQ